MASNIIIREKDGTPTRQHISSGNDFQEAFRILIMAYSDDIKFQILKCLCEKEVASMREIARCVGISPKNITKYLDQLQLKGIVEVAYSRSNIKLYKITEEASLIKRAFPSAQS
ncbi:MAG: winged helix-turn-helix domain-containing protein [Nitrososphaeria archaeon]